MTEPRDAQPADQESTRPARGRAARIPPPVDAPDVGPSPTIAPTRPRRAGGGASASAAAAQTATEGSQPARVELPTPVSGFRKFVVESEIGRGGIGVVQAAEDTVLRRDLAIKMLRQADDELAISQFIEEAQITGQLQHPNIVPVHELGVDDDGRPWLAMKRIQGESLQDWIRRHRDDPLTPQRIARLLSIFQRVCDAVAFAHDRRVLHRDLKPPNVMVGEFGEVLVLDWGVARPLADRSEDSGGPANGGRRTPRRRVSSFSPRPAGPVRSSRRDQAEEAGIELTIDGDVVGTPAYMPPEQSRGEIATMDERSDIFALGGILYAMLTGQHPYARDNAAAALFASMQHHLDPPRQRAPHRRIPRELEAIVGKAMAAAMDDRYPTVKALQDDLRRYLEFRPTTARRAPLVERFIRLTRRRPLPVIIAGMVTVFVAIFAVVVSVLVAEREAAARAAAEARESARDARLQALATEGRMDELREELGVQVRDEADLALDDFRRYFTLLFVTGRSDEETSRILAGDEQSRRYVEAFRRAVAAGKVGSDVTHEDWYWYGKMLSIIEGKHAEAVEAFNRAIELAPRHSWGYGGRAEALFRLGKIEESLADLDRAIALDAKPDPSHIFNRGQAYRMLGRIEPALADFRRVSELEPDHADAWCLQAELLLMTNRPAEALEACNAAMRSGRARALAHVLRGRAHEETGDDERARLDFEVATTMEPDNARAWEQLGWVHYRARRAQVAFDAFRQATRADPRAGGAWVGRAQLWLEAGELQEAIDDASAAVASDPESVQPWLTRAVARDRSGDAAGAESDYTRALALQPDHAPALYNRGRCREELGNPQGALADYSAAVHSNPRMGEAWVHRGLLRENQGDADGAIADFERAVEANPALWQGSFHRGRMREQRGDKPGALADYRVARANCSDPDGRAMLDEWIRALERD